MKNLLFFLLFFPSIVFGQNVADSLIDGMYIQELNLINGTYELRTPNPVKIKLINSTGYDIKSLIFYSIYFPILSKDSATQFFQIPNYEISDFVVGEIKELEIDNNNWVWCGTKKQNIFNFENKTLIIEIIAIQSKMLENHYFLGTKIKQVIE